MQIPVLLSPCVTADISSKMLDRVHQQLGDVAGIVNISMGLFFAQLKVVGRFK